MNKIPIHILCVQDLGALTFNSFSTFYQLYSLHKFGTQLGEAETWGFFISKSLSAQIKISPPSHSVKARCSLISLTFPEHTLNIVNTYAPPSDKRADYSHHLADFLSQHKLTHENTIILGDLNDYLDSNLDRWCNAPTKSAHKLRGDILRPLINKKFVDAFRYFNPDRKCFTRFGFQSNLLQKVDKIICTRIDHILVGKTLLPNIQAINIFEEQLIDSDHRLVTIDLQMSSAVQNVPLPVTNPFIRKYPDTKKKTTDEVKKLWKENYGQKVFQLLSELLPQLNTLPSSVQEIDHLALNFTKILHDSTEKVFGWSDNSDKSTNRPIVGHSEYGKLKKLRILCRSLSLTLIIGIQNDAAHITVELNQDPHPLWSH